MTILLDDLNFSTRTAVHGLATPDELALLAWDDEHKTDAPRPEIVNRRYVLPDPTTGDAAKWTRVTTFCEAIDDGSGLTIWKLGLTVRGLVHNDALLTQAKAEHDNDKALRAIAEEAHLFAGSKLSAAVGTALHTATEHHDLGTGHRPPDPWGRHVDAWAAALAEHGIEILPAWIERTVVLPALGVAGTLDRLVRLPDGRIVVLDVKTGKDVRKANYAVQAAVYANATHAWTPAGYEPMPDVDKTTALIAHLSAVDGTCSIVAVDIAKGWEKAQVCALVREARSVAGIFTKAKPAEKVAPPVDERATEARGRIEALRGDDLAIRTITADWPADVPKPGAVKKGEATWTDAHLDAIEALLHQCDGKESTFLGTPDPELVAKAEAAVERLGTTTASPINRTHDDGDTMDTGDGDALKAAAQALGDDARHRLAGWQAEAKRGGRQWGTLSPPSARTHAIVVAAMRCAAHLADDDTDPDALTRGALSLVIGEQVQPAWTTGVVLGSLTIAEALSLDEYAAAFAAGDHQAVKQLGCAAIHHIKEQ